MTIEEEYEECITELNTEIANLNHEVMSLEQQLDSHKDREDELVEYVADKLSSPIMKHWNLSRVVRWLVDKVEELEKETAGE